MPAAPGAPAYFDCNATTPIDSRVLDVVVRYLRDDFGNAGSRTHDYGARAKQAVQLARDQVASVVDAKRDEVVFTSGATESNNIAILGLEAYGTRTGRRHVVSTAIEHKAVLEPLQRLAERGFEVTLVRPTSGGRVDAEAIVSAVRDDTILVSVMHANNETGVVQPIDELAERMEGHDAFLHVDAAQGFGKELERLRHPRIDLVSVSGHKVHAPKGVGALIARRRRFERPPLSPLQVGGGQEWGFRPGTLPVHLIAGLGEAARVAVAEAVTRQRACKAIRERLLNAVRPFGAVLNGDPAHVLPHVANISFPGLDSEAVLLALKDQMALSNGAACTSQSYELSHVLLAMGCAEPIVRGAVRFSWCHLGPEPDWDAVTAALRVLT